MSQDDKFTDPRLEKALSEIHNEAIDPATLRAAADRVWGRIAGPIRTCADYQALFPDYRAGRLSEARALLVKYHTHECVACRKVFEGKVRMMPVPAERARMSWFAKPVFQWALAASVVAAAGLWVARDIALPGASRAVVETANGALYRASDGVATPVKPGETLPGGAEIRTAKGSGAVLRLADGSLVEMRERSALSVTAGWRNLTVNLGRGSVIVQAAKRRSGALYVAARDCRVSVTGTVFSVNSGMVGSRVSVIEGEVRVAQGSAEKVLRPGEQFSTHPAVSAVPVADEIAWSRNVDRYVALLREFSALQKKIEELRLPGLRYSSRLAGLLPADTVLFASLPNLGKTLGEVQEIFRQRTQESAVLREWFQELERGKGGPKLDEMMARLRALADFLGDEIVIAAALDERGRLDEPVFLAEVRRSGFREYLEREFGPVRGLHILARPDMVALAPDAGTLASIEASLEGRGGFAGTPFYERVTQAYRDGAGVLFTVDLGRLTSTGSHHKVGQLALGGLRDLVIEQTDSGGRTETRASLSFSGSRKGVAAWLAAPAPVAGLDFISPDASLAASFTIQNPASVIDELFALAAAADPNFRKKLAELEAQLGFSIRDDLAASLGGEITVGVDGPLLPPSWKLIAEVYNPGRLQWIVQKLVEVYNREASAHGKPGMTLSQEVASGRTYYKIVVAGVPFGEAHYVFLDGYLIAAPSRQLLDNAIQYRATGYSLVRSQKFLSLVPRDRNPSFSGVIYQNAGSALAPVVEGLGSTGTLTPQQRQAMASFAAEMKPMLIAVYAEGNRVTFSSTQSLLGLSLGNLTGASGPLGLARMMRMGKAGGTQRRGPA